HSSRPWRGREGGLGRKRRRKPSHESFRVALRLRVPRVAPCQLLRLALVGDAGPDELVIAGARPLHLVPLALLTDRALPDRLPRDSHFVHDPGFVHRTLRAGVATAMWWICEEQFPCLCKLWRRAQARASGPGAPPWVTGA